MSLEIGAYILKPTLLVNRQAHPMAVESYLFRFGYSWPEELEWVETHVDADLGEASEIVFIRATSETEALALGEQLADEFVRALYGDRAYSWRDANFASWLESDPEMIAWASDNRIPVLESPGEIARVATELAERVNEGA